MFFADLNARERAHLGGLLATYPRWCREQGLRPEPGLVQLAEALLSRTGAVPSGQERTTSADPAGVVDDDGDDFLTMAGVARVLQLSERTVRRRVREGRLTPTYVGSRRRPRFRRDDVMAAD